MATSTVSTATLNEMTVADIHSVLEKKLRYQRSDSSLGGNSRNSDGENDIGTTMAIGTSRKAPSRSA